MICGSKIWTWFYSASVCQLYLLNMHRASIVYSFHHFEGWFIMTNALWRVTFWVLNCCITPYFSHSPVWVQVQEVVSKLSWRNALDCMVNCLESDSMNLCPGHLLAVWPTANHLNILCFSLLFCNMTIIGPIS